MNALRCRQPGAMREVVSDAADSAAATRQRNCARDGHVNKAFTDGGDNAERIELGNTQHVGAPTQSNALVGGIAEPSAAVDDDEAKECGCCMMRPLFLRRFRTAKWVLFWLCWAGAAQDNFHSFYITENQK
ncbi:hypothetical protein J437_LFUL004815 [Ladona fulva]|uniref:Uncharacterized protein n=1 Tax=Ladona fulva TaxID=123851 RepID=A0A8K0K5A0_LADFU|nr:hypothetical protein J437_LFUL004815 [Ladona fulva]